MHLFYMEKIVISVCFFGEIYSDLFDFALFNQVGIKNALGSEFRTIIYGRLFTRMRLCCSKGLSINGDRAPYGNAINGSAEAVVGAYALQPF